MARVDGVARGVGRKFAAGKCCERIHFGEQHPVRIDFADVGRDAREERAHIVDDVINLTIADALKKLSRKTSKLPSALSRHAPACWNGSTTPSLQIEMRRGFMVCSRVATMVLDARSNSSIGTAREIPCDTSSPSSGDHARPGAARCGLSSLGPR